MKKRNTNHSEVLIMSKNSNKISYQGVFPIAPTPFQEDGSLDLDSQKRVLDCMIDQGVDGICILANYSEQFLLSDEERDILLELCLNHVAGRVPVIVTCSHFSSRIACERAKKSEAAGAKMLMLMPPYHGAALKADEKGIYEHFQQISEAVSIPIMIQDAPLSGVSLSVDLLVRMARELDGVSCRFTDLQAGRGEGANRWYYVVLMQGRNREVRRLWESQGLRVSRLKRVRYGNVFIPSVAKVGRWKDLSREEVKGLYELAAGAAAST